MTLNELKAKIIEVGGHEDDPIHFMTSYEVCGSDDHSYWASNSVKVKRDVFLSYQEVIYTDYDSFEDALLSDLEERYPDKTEDELKQEMSNYIRLNDIDLSPAIVVYLNV